MARTSAPPQQALLAATLLFAACFAPASCQPADAMAAAPQGSAAPAAAKDAIVPASQNMTAFFPKINGDLTAVTWAHAVNSASLLEAALNDSVMMLEADVVMGKTPSSATEEPVMGHPPDVTSDLSLMDFLRNVTAFNVDNKDKRKGIKLDFKSIEVFEKALDFIKSNFGKTPEFPVWLNADILPGPVNATAALPVDAKRFLDRAKANYPELMLSLGWTTRWGKGLDGEDPSQVPVGEVKYSEDNVKDMIAALNASSIDQPITYAVRAAFVAHSLDTLKTLLDQTPQASGMATLTVWSSDETDTVDVKQLKKNILALGKSRVYVDVGKKLAKELDLAHSASTTTLASVATTVLALFAVMLRAL